MTLGKVSEEGLARGWILARGWAGRLARRLQRGIVREDGV